MESGENVPHSMRSAGVMGSSLNLRIVNVDPCAVVFAGFLREFYDEGVEDGGAFVDNAGLHGLILGVEDEDGDVESVAGYVLDVFVVHDGVYETFAHEIADYVIDYFFAVADGELKPVVLDYVADFVAQDAACLIFGEVFRVDIQSLKEPLHNLLPEFFKRRVESRLKDVVHILVCAFVEGDSDICAGFVDAVYLDLLNAVAAAELQIDERSVNFRVILLSLSLDECLCESEESLLC